MFRIFAVFILILIVPSLSQAQSYDPAAAAASEIRFQQLEKEIRRLTGMVEEQNYEIRRLKNELSKATGDLEMRVNDLEGGNKNIKSAVEIVEGAKPSSEKPKDIVKSDIVKSDIVKDEVQTLGTISTSQNTGAVSSYDDAPKAYDYAYSFIKQRDFERAEVAFAEFMRKFPDHPLTANAQYWYGETFYVRGGYEKAARIFAQGYKKYPKGSKAASNLLKLGMALTGMGKKDDACVAYKQLKKDYAKSSVPVLKRAETEMKRINCS